MLPLPNQIQKDLQNIAALAKRLEQEYEWAYPLCYSKSYSQEVKVSGSGVSDATGQIVASGYHQRIRSELTEASKHIERARRQLLGAMARLNDVLGDGDHVLHPDDETFDVRQISKEEHEHWVAMQAKRDGLRGNL